MKLNIPLKFFLLIVAMCLLTSDGFSQRRERHRKFDPVQFQKRAGAVYHHSRWPYAGRGRCLLPRIQGDAKEAACAL